MRKIILDQKKPIIKPNIPIEAEIISPNIFYNKSLEDIQLMEIYRGNKKIMLKDVFDISGDATPTKKAEDIEITISGDLSKYKRIGQEMSEGSILVNGNIGMHVGNQMSGGKIIINGDADDFAGAKMTGGLLHIKGNAGHYLGGSFRGDWRGMSGGKIIVEGNVRNECASWMRNGLIEIKGNAGMFLGIHLHKGTIVVNGDVTERAGAEMTGGIIVIKGKLHKILPSFEFREDTNEIDIEDFGLVKGPFLTLEGDYAEKKQGMIYLLKKNNS